MFHSEDYELLVLQHNCCPYCRRPIDEPNWSTSNESSYLNHFDFGFSNISSLFFYIVIQSLLSHTIDIVCHVVMWMCCMSFLKLPLESGNTCRVCPSVIIECKKGAPSASHPSWIMRIRLPWAVTDYIITLKGTWMYSVKTYIFI